MNKEKICQQIKDILNENDHYFKSAVIEKIVDNWYSEKLTLIEILRKHPNWNEDQMAVVLTTESSRIMDINSARFALNKIDCEFHNQFSQYMNSSIYTLISTIISEEKTFISENIVALAKGYIPAAKEGMKASRLIGKLFEYDIAQKSEGKSEEKIQEFRAAYNREFATLANALNPLTVHTYSILSVHPCDYLTMSNGNSWVSCHNIYDGCYMAGTLSYMGDPSSMIFYTLDSDFSGTEFFTGKKLTRQVYAYQNNLLLQSRLYPDYYNDAQTQTNRAIVQSIIAESLGEPDYWNTEKCDHGGLDYIWTTEDSNHYADYIYSEYKSTISKLKDKQYKDIIIGSLAICIQCGKTHSNQETLTCDYCDDGKSTYCEDCGERINEGDICYVNGRSYCEHCVSYCEHCQEYVRDDIRRVRNYGDVCVDCLHDSGSFFKCDYCDEWYKENRMSSYETIDNETICENCLDHYVTCENCGELVEDRNAIKTHKGMYCKDCHDEINMESIEESVEISV
jgi:hypothetical protein